MFRVVILTLMFLCRVSHGHGHGLYLTENGRVKDEVYRLISHLGYQGPNDLAKVSDFAQKNLLRPANTERWDLKDDEKIEIHREKILGTLKKLKFFERISPAQGEQFDSILIMGATAQRMRQRVDFLRSLMRDGLQFECVYFLTGERPLDPKIEDRRALFDASDASQRFRAGWIAPNSIPKTESEAARLVWDQLMPADMKLPKFIDVPIFREKRPATVDTIQAWLASKPKKGKTLVISNNPYVSYQHAVVVGTLLESEFINEHESTLIHTVGEEANIATVGLRVVLDSLARTLFNEKKVWDIIKSNKKTPAKPNSNRTPPVTPKKFIYVLVDKNFRGDENQLLGIQSALQKMNSLKFRNLSYAEFDFVKARKHHNPLIFMLSGSPGIRFIKDNAQNLSKKDLIIWSGYQVFTELADVANKIAVAFLPKHAFDGHNPLSKKTKVVLLDGVPHRIMKSTLDEARQRYEDKHGPLPSDVNQVTAIVLPGDAPDESGEMKFFTLDDARILARNIVKVEGSKRHFLVTNGPRTGSYNYQTRMKLDPSPHSVKIVDAVSTAFIGELRKLGVNVISFFDFQFSDLPSAYESFLSLATKGVRIHIPGESTSVITEATDVTDNLCIDIVPSMNPIHHRHVEEIGEAGKAAILTWKGKFTKKPLKNVNPTGETPAEVAADFLVEFFSKTH